MHLGKEWLVNENVKGAGGAQKQLFGKEPLGEPTIYLRVDNNDTRHYGAMHYDEVAAIFKANHHAHEIIVTS